MADILERPPTERPRQRPRKPVRVSQPESLAALRPSQHRAARNRAARTRESAIEYWLRRLSRL